MRILGNPQPLLESGSLFKEIIVINGGRVLPMSENLKIPR